MANDTLRDREKALEESFFARQNEKLRQTLRRREQAKTSREELARISGIADAEILEKLVALGIGGESWTALAVVPLVEVAWANGMVDAKERRAVLAGAEANGIMAGSPSYQVLEGWLSHRPDGRLLQAWGEYIVGLCGKLDPAGKHALREEVMGRARSVAKATGGFLGLGERISPEEEIVLQELEKAFQQ